METKTIKQYQGFKTYQDAYNFKEELIKKNFILIGFGYSKEKKHFFEVKELIKEETAEQEANDNISDILARQKQKERGLLK